MYTNTPDFPEQLTGDVEKKGEYKQQRLKLEESLRFLFLGFSAKKKEKLSPNRLVKVVKPWEMSWLSIPRSDRADTVGDI